MVQQNRLAESPTKIKILYQSEGPDSNKCHPKIAIVVPTFNRLETTLRFIKNVKAHNERVAIYVCDSGSSDGTIEALQGIHDVEIIDAGPNAWWSAAVNKGIKRVLNKGLDAVLIMNDDIEFANDLIPGLLKKHRQYPTAIISPSQMTPSGQFIGIRYKGRSKKMNVIRVATADASVDTTNGCCLLIPKCVFAEAGLIDEVNCPHQYGDTEFQLRARNFGFPTVACPSIRINQLGATDYYSRIKLGTMLRFAGSPIHIGAYLQFGKTLFNGKTRFLIFGIYYHYGYFKTLIKSVIHIATRQASCLKRDK